MKGGVNIVIAQTYQNDLDRIRNRVSPDCRNSISYFNEPAEAVSEALSNPVDIVVTGECFYHTDLTSIHDVLGALMSGSVSQHFSRKSLDSGADLAKAVHVVKPDLLVLRYSGTPDDYPIESGFVGDIPKGGSDAIYDFVNCNELSDILAAKDWKRMRKRFPKIRFYRNLEEQK